MIPQCSTAFSRDHTNRTCHPTPLGVLGSPLSPQHFRKATFSPSPLRCESKKTDLAWLHLKLQLNLTYCHLILGGSPGSPQPLAEETVQARCGISTDVKVFIWALKRRCRVRIWRGRQALWNRTAIRQTVLCSQTLKWLAVPTGLMGLFTWKPVRKAPRSCDTFLLAGLAVLEAPLRATLSTPAETLVAIRRRQSSEMTAAGFCSGVLQQRQQDQAAAGLDAELKA